MGRSRRLEDERVRNDAVAAMSEARSRPQGHRLARAAIPERRGVRGSEGRPLVCSDSSTMIDGQDLAIPNACVERGGSLATAPCADRRIVASTSHLFAVKEAA